MMISIWPTGVLPSTTVAVTIDRVRVDMTAEPVVVQHVLRLAADVRHLQRLAILVNDQTCKQCFVAHDVPHKTRQVFIHRRGRRHRTENI